MENQTSVAPIVTPQVVVKEPKANSFLIILLSTLLLASVVTVGFFAYQTQNLVKELNLLKAQPTPTAVSESVVSSELTFEQDKTLDPTANWKTYSSTKYNYSIKYPDNWTPHSLEPGPGEVALNSTSKGFSVHPNIYKDTVNAKTYIQVETDGVGNLAFPTYEKYLESIKTPYFTVKTITEQTFSGINATIVEGNYNGYGFPANIKVINFPSSDRKIYYSITILTSEDSTYGFVVNQILSTFKFTN